MAFRPLRDGFRRLGSAGTISGAVAINGNLDVTGNITATGDIDGATLGGAATLDSLIVAGATNLQGPTQLDQTLRVIGITTLFGGSLAAPGLTFDGGGASSGLFMSTADQLQVARLGVSQMKLSSAGGPTFDVAFSTGAAANVSSSLNVQAKFAIESETLKTANYQLTNSDSWVKFNGTTLVMTSPATPGANQTLVLCNINASPGTFARNGLLINGAAADAALPTGLSVWSWDASAGSWYGG